MYFLVSLEGQWVAYTIPISCQIFSTSFKPFHSTTYHGQLFVKLKLGCCFLDGLPLLCFLASLTIEEIQGDFLDIEKRPHHIPINLTNMEVGEEEALV